jgi:hypothetical protein
LRSWATTKFKRKILKHGVTLVVKQLSVLKWAIFVVVILCRNIGPTSEDIHMKGAQTWTLEKGNNMERKEFYSETNTF